MIKSGIDTLDLITEENREKEIKGFEGVDQQKTTPIKRGYKIVVKPSIKKNRTSTRQEVQSYIEGITEKIGECKIERLDLSTDYRNLDLETDKDYKLLRLFIECVRKIRNSKKPTFSTIVGLRKKGNIKIKTDSLQLTIYNCKDKERESNVRLEYRFNKLEEDDLYKVIDRSKNKIFKELKYIKEVIPIVEQYYTKELIKIYNDDLKTKLIVDFRDFIVKYSEDILTKKIFDNVYDACNCKGDKDKWLERYRKKRTLKFISGRQLNIFKNDLKRSIKVV